VGKLRKPVKDPSKRLRPMRHEPDGGATAARPQADTGHASHRLQADNWHRAGITGETTAAQWAAAQVEHVRDDPAGRLALTERAYNGPFGQAPQHLPFRRAALSFMRWQAERGVLRALDANPPGSPWWRAVNDRLLLDGCEALAHSGGLTGPASSPTIALWMSFIAAPTGRNWYRAHNASIVRGYLENRDLADQERKPERFFFNVVLLRVLYAHALNAAPRMALGWFAPAGRVLGDPRVGMAGAFLSLGRVLPTNYPPRLDLETTLKTEHGLGRMLDYGVIAPRLHALYDWSAQELGLPDLRSLIRDGSPIYAWSYADRHVWRQAPESLPVRLLRVATSRP
jgi:hypothetical protein